MLDLLAHLKTIPFAFNKKAEPRVWDYDDGYDYDDDDDNYVDDVDDGWGWSNLKVKPIPITFDKKAEARVWETSCCHHTLVFANKPDVDDDNDDHGDHGHDDGHDDDDDFAVITL